MAVVAQSFEMKPAARIPNVLDAASELLVGIAVAPISDPVNSRLKYS